MWHTKRHFFRKMQFWSHCYTVVSYQALFRLTVYKIPAVYLSGAKNVCFCTIRDFGSPTKTRFCRTPLLISLGCKNIAYKRPTYQKPRGRRDSYKAVDGILISSSRTGRARKTLWRVKLPGLNKVKVVSIQSTGMLALAWRLYNLD